MNEEEYFNLNSTINSLNTYQDQVHILSKKVEHFSKLVQMSLESLETFKPTIEKIKVDFAEKITNETNESLNRNLARLRDEHFKD